MSRVKANGTNLFYKAQGRGPPLLLIHGTGGNADVFDRIIQPLAETYRVIAYDRRSFSRSAAPPHPAKHYHEHHAQDAAALLQALDAAPATVFGWSGGGLVALALACTAPSVVKRLVLYEPPFLLKSHPTFKVATSFARITLQRLVGAKRAAAETFLRFALMRPSGGNDFDSLDDAQRAALLANASGIMSELDGGTAEDLALSDLQAITCPVALIMGADTAPFLASAGQRLKRAMPQIQERVVPGTGHAMQILTPDKFLEAFRGLSATAN